MIPDVTLTVDGVRMADGAPGDPEDAPTALSGLSITWGRVTTVDQVEPSSCSFDAMDLAGGDAFLGRLYVGATVRVSAGADVYPPASLPGNLDPSFEDAALGTVLPWLITAPGAARAIVVDESIGGLPPHTGAHSVVVQQAGGARIHIPPAPLAATDVAAWDDLPVLADGQDWAGSVALIVPDGAQLSVRAGLYRNATDRAPVPAGAAVTVTGTAGPDWQTANITLTGDPSTAGRWVGLYLQVALPAWDTYPPVAWQDVDPAWTWTRTGELRIDDVTILAPDPSQLVRRDVVVFDGRISEVDAGWDDSIPGVVCSVVAVDFTADLANRDLGDVPWPAETIAARFAHIMAAAGVTIPYTIDPSLSGVRVSWLDIDNQQCWPLLADLATTCDGVLWSATHRTTGPYLYLADPAAQSALYTLELLDGVVVIVPTSAADDGIVLDACDVLLDPVVFRQATSDVTTRAVISWQEQTLDADGVTPAPTERTLTVVDAPLETQLGTRRIAVTTQLTTSAAAQALADRVLARLHKQSWRVGGLTWATALGDLGPDAVGRILDLLDGTRRLGAPVILQNLPAWSPTGPTVPLFLQGGTYTVEDGAWTLDLTTASAQSQGTSLSWNDVPAAYTWDMFDPSITWDDLIGVAP